jgi:exonuclease III
MRILGLNCQGLGNDPAVRELSDLRRRIDPDVLFLSETHLDDFPAECLRRRLKMDSKIVNPSDGRSGGVLMLWKKEIKIQQKNSAPKYIDVQITETPDKIWRLTGLYGEPRWEDKYKTWDKIRELKTILIYRG